MLGDKRGNNKSYRNNEGRRNNNYSQNDQGSARYFRRGRQGYNNDQDSRRNSSNNHSHSNYNNYNNYNNNPLKDRDQRGHANEQGASYCRSRSRASPYGEFSCNNRSRQSSRVRTSRVCPPVREKQEMTPYELNTSDTHAILASWDSQPENYNGASGNHQRTEGWRAASENPSLLKENPSNEGTDYDGDWVISESTSSNLIVNRHQSPTCDFEDEDVFWNNKGKLRAREQERCDGYNKKEIFKCDNDDDYKGKNFTPPYPIVPVSSSTELATVRPRIDRIFENESRNSARTFDSLEQIANRLWGTNTDVPLGLAKQDVNPEELEELLKASGLNKEISKENMKSDMKSYVPTERTESSKERRSSDTKSSALTKKSENPKERCTSSTCDPDTKNSSPTASRKRPEAYLNISFLSAIRDISNNNRMIYKEISIQRTRHNEVCEKVNALCRSPPGLWLDSILGYAHTLIPSINSLDTLSMQNLIKMLSSNTVLKENDKDSEYLFKQFIEQHDFFEKLFSHMKDDVFWGSDFLPIIKLTDFIVKLFPKIAQRIPHKEISDVLNKLESTFSKHELDEASARLKDIEECISNQMKTRRITDGSPKKSQKPKPEWIIMHSKNHVEKPSVPLPEEIFDLKSIMNKPRLTPLLANRPWFPEYEDVYRQVHYDLLRSEIVEDIQRASVAFFAANCQEYPLPENSPLHNYIFYNDVRIVNTCVDKNFTPYVRVGFKPSRPVDWIKGEHLIYGTFVLLFKIKTEFNNVSVDISSMTWATVEHFNLDDVVRPNCDKNLYWKSNESFVGLYFSSSEFEKLDINGNYIMLESTINYASIRPVMEWLKESSIQKCFPLYRELLTCDQENNPIPAYLENVSFDITSLLVDQSETLVVKDRSEWPKYSDSNGPVYNMEVSCVAALRQIISRKVAVIMTPVVTSKSAVASKAVEFLNRALKQSHCFEPILILTRSSYALDSILEQLLPSFPDLIRCGSLSKCNNPALNARQIQNVVDDHIASKKTSLRRDWFRTCSEMSSKQRELAELWRFREYALSKLYFVETCPRDFRNQLIPANLKARGYEFYGFESENAMLVHFLELWLSKESINENLLRSSITKNKQIGLTERDFPAISNTSSRFNLRQNDVRSNFVRPPQEIYPRNLPSLLSELSKSYLFENVAECNDNEMSVPSPFDKEILDHQIDDRVIFKSESDQVNTKFFGNHKAEFIKFSREFWKNGGPNIWTMTLEQRNSLYNNFRDRHFSFCDQRIYNLQKNAILEAEKAKSTLIARWSEVCSFTPVVGMTVSNATAYREILTAIKPRVCIVDEASEILESQLLYLISSDRLEHLIMFGDYQYSKPDIKSNTSQKCGLDVSLFERWIKCNEDSIRLKEQSRMHPDVYELVCTLYDEKVKTSIVKNTPSILGVPSHVFFMTHNNFDERWTSFKKTNIFEAEFIVKFAFYLYQQGYDPAKITILTPHLSQKLLILKSLNPELKQERSEDLHGRFDKERSQTGKIKVELIDNYNSDENHIVLLSLVAVSKNWHDEALRTLDNKKRAIIALSRALHALYIFGNDKMLEKSKIWAPVVEKLASRKSTFGKSLILTCNNHPNKKIEITTLDDFKNKVPYGGCSEPCRVSLKCGHACPRKCHPIQHTEEVNYICNRPCGGQYRPEGVCGHNDYRCPKKCYECERSGKCPPCDLPVEIRLRCGHQQSVPCYSKVLGRANYACESDVYLGLRCGHYQLVKCHQKDNEEFKMTVECKEMKQFTFPNCNHSAILPCSTRSSVCKEPCDKKFPCGHPCQRQCGTKHSHERSDCPKECTKSLICGHMCSSGCSKPNNHTSFCNKPCRIKCLHGRVCPKTCYEACTKCLEPCPWRCSHYRCTKRCNEPCNRPPCNKRCPRTLRCNHQCNGYCGEKCPPCILCYPKMQCSITFFTFSEMDEDDRLYVLPECNCVFTADGLDSYFKNQVKNGDHTAVKLWQCPKCEQPIFTAMRYNHYLKTEINLWNVIKQKQELKRNLLSDEERRQISSVMDEETRATDFNSMVGGRWFVCPNNHPYYIGSCGGATQISKCPDCSAIIGGTQHKVISSNRFYGEFDNSARPAWPGQH